MATRRTADAARLLATRTTIEEMVFPLFSTPEDGEHLVFSGLTEIDYRGFRGGEMIGDNRSNVKYMIHKDRLQRRDSCRFLGVWVI